MSNLVVPLALTREIPVATSSGFCLRGDRIACAPMSSSTYQKPAEQIYYQALPRGRQSC